FLKTQPHFLRALVNREQTILRSARSLAQQFLLAHDRRQAPLPAFFGAPGIGKSSLGLYQLHRILASPYLFHQLKKVTAQDPGVYDVVRVILHLYRTGRQISVLACRDFATAEGLPVALYQCARENYVDTYDDPPESPINNEDWAGLPPQEQCWAVLDNVEATQKRMLARFGEPITAHPSVADHLPTSD
ncbi:hypothetical protein KIPB_010101, partial [Kipferlia bialata]